MNQQEIGKFISKLRKEKEMTQQELADKLGVTDKAISKWENGRCLMDISMLKPLSELLDVSIIELINGEKNNDIDDFVDNTIKLASNNIKNKIRSVVRVLVVSIIIILIGVCYTVYKIVAEEYIYNASVNYCGEITDDYFKNVSFDINYEIDSKEVDNYLELRNNIKIRNDFNNMELLTIDNYITYYDIDKMEYISFTYDENSFINKFIYENNTGRLFDTIKYRKNLLDRNNIINDIDLFKYVYNNYYKEDSYILIRSLKDIKIDFLIDTFINYIFYDKEITSFITLSNDNYYGYIIEDASNTWEVYIYGVNNSIKITFNGDKYNLEYILDLVSTTVI